MVFLKPYAPQLLSVLRIIAGLLLLQHGTAKYLNIPPTPMYGASPFTMSGAAGVLELVGGVLVVLGLFTRPVAFILSGMLAVAYFYAMPRRISFRSSIEASWRRSSRSCSSISRRRARALEPRQVARSGMNDVHRGRCPASCAGTRPRWGDLSGSGSKAEMRSGGAASSKAIAMSAKPIKPKRKGQRERNQPAAKARSRAPARRSSGKWSASVTRDSNALDLEQGVFTKPSPGAIARSLKRSAERSGRRKARPYQSAMSMLTFYINRAGRNLPKARLAVLERAKGELRKVFGR